MIIFESVQVALAALWANKLRALLTMLGVIIGVMSVIVMISLVQGIRQQVLDQFAGNGANLLFASYQPKVGTVARGGFSGLTMDDARAVAARATLINAVSPKVDTSVVAQNGPHRRQVTLSGVEDTFAQTFNITPAAGRFLRPDDVAGWGKACVLGQKAKDDLFPGTDPLGKELLCSTIDGSKVSLVVVGFLAKKDASFSGDFNNSIFTSLSTVQKRFSNSDKIDGFTARAVDISEAEAAADQAWSILKQRHPLNYKDFVVDTQEGILKQIDTVLNGIQLVLGGVGGLALLTGGIGIMNIMLVSVTERTREIGIRLAIGAVASEVLLQFLVEAVALSCLGGLIGLALAQLAIALIVPLMQVPWLFDPQINMVAFAISAVIGVVFGYFPARRAAALNPIDALRHE